MPVNNRFNLTPKTITTAEETAAVAVESLPLGRTYVLEQITSKRYLYKLNLDPAKNTLVVETNDEQAYVANFYTNNEIQRFDLKVDSALDPNIRYYSNRITGRVLGVDIPPQSVVYVQSADNIIISGLFIALTLVYPPFPIELIP